MSKALAYARGRIIRGSATRIGQIIHARNMTAWAKRMNKSRDFLRKRVVDPNKWRGIDSHIFAEVVGITFDKADALVNAEIAYREVLRSGESE